MTNNYRTAIIFFPEEKKMRPHKYRNINQVEKFMQFAATKGAVYVNFYDKKKKTFIEQKKINIQN